jgi:hypothetical protein
VCGGGCAGGHYNSTIERIGGSGRENNEGNFLNLKKKFNSFPFHEKCIAMNIP